MAYVPSVQVSQYINEGTKLDVKAVANDIYNVQFPQLLTDWLDTSKDFNYHGKSIPADQKNTTAGNMAFQQQIQDLTNEWTFIFTTYSNQINMEKDAQKIT